MLLIQGPRVAKQCITGFFQTLSMSRFVSFHVLYICALCGLRDCCVEYRVGFLLVVWPLLASMELGPRETALSHPCCLCCAGRRDSV